MGDSIQLVATADSGLPVTFAVSTPDVCSISEPLLVLEVAGLCSVTASQPGDATWVAAEDVTASVAVVGSQSIAVKMAPSAYVGSVVALVASSDAGLPIAWAVMTPAICTLGTTSVTLDTPGTCTLTASQAGDTYHAAASGVTVHIESIRPPGGVDLGLYAVNGAVRAIVTDATTGRTYLGGSFTKVGLRTGPVAVVSTPDAGDGSLQAGSPEVLGTVRQVVADDRPGDPGFFIIGELTAIDGVPVPASPVTRMHLDPAGSRWVVDAGWKITGDPDACSVFARMSTFSGDAGYTITPQHLIGRFMTSAGNTTGLFVINRTTGACTTSLPGVTSPLPVVADCAALPYCYATVFAAAYDPAANRLFVVYRAWVGATSIETRDSRSFLVAYDLGPGTRRWVVPLQSEMPAGSEVYGGGNWTGWATGAAYLEGKVLLAGTFPLDPVDATTFGASRLVAFDAATGTIVQRWNDAGEEHLADGSFAGAGSTCVGSAPGSPYFELDGAIHAWMSKWSYSSDGSATWGSRLCRYELMNGRLTGELADVIALEGSEGLPTVPYTAPGGRSLLLGTTRAIDLGTGDQVAAWNPDPGNASMALVTLAVSSAGVVLGGDFQFVRGITSPGIVAMTTSMSPDPAFVSPVVADPQPEVMALALDQGWLLAGGEVFFPRAPGADWNVRSLAAFDPVDGHLLDWSPQATPPGAVRTIAVDPVSGEFWAGGDWRGTGGTDAAPLRHYASPSSGAGDIARSGPRVPRCPVHPRVPVLPGVRSPGSLGHHR